MLVVITPRRKTYGLLVFFSTVMSTTSISEVIQKNIFSVTAQLILLKILLFVRKDIYMAKVSKPLAYSMYCTLSYYAWSLLIGVVRYIFRGDRRGEIGKKKFLFCYFLLFFCRIGLRVFQNPKSKFGSGADWYRYQLKFPFVLNKPY